MGIAEMLASKVIDAAGKKIKEHHNNAGSNHSSNINPDAKITDKNSSLPPLQVQIYSHNIRQDASNRKENEKPWSQRKQGVIAAINFGSSQNIPTLVGLQEVKQNQLNDVLQGLGSHWSYFGVGRDDGKSKGEFAPILYRNTEWELLSGKTIWLGTTPDRPSKGWDAAYERIVTFVIVKHKKLGKIINYLNTHYDHRGKKAREMSSKQIIDLMNKSQGTSLLSGDFNSEKHEEAYQTLSKSLYDTACYCKDKRGFENTDTGFETGRKEKSIDFIWAPKGVPILKHEVLPSEYQGFLMSDHRPVTAIFQV